ncbi:hypothetical protein SASPL_104702 [Salvia splendens]|uniref:AB hydrolase-1 domain-containing protein n=1 Tax=Salvia splendens TaxID=180675 RepID=A0A8X8YHP1_SALSN|nr:hypothetical protein SASPL_104702 [Salvia splendens]
MVFKKVVILMMGCLGMSKQPTLPAPPAETAESSSTDVQICGSKRIRLSDGRFLAYTERGVPMNKSSHRVIVVHGFGSSKEMNFMASQDLLEELKICLLLFDRAGYGESDPNPKRSLKSEASDIEELADKLQQGSKFFVLGVSLAGVALVVPYINYKWPSLPSEQTRDDYRMGLSRWAVFVASHAPRLLYWWLTQKLFPSSTVLDRNPAFFSRKDLEVLKITPGYQLLNQWDFDPLELCNPYPQEESTVHIWQGHEDKVLPFQLQRHVSGKLPWVRYHEVPDGGHQLVYDSDVCEAILRSLVLGEDPPQMYRPQC